MYTVCNISVFRQADLLHFGLTLKSKCFKFFEIFQFDHCSILQAAQLQIYFNKEEFKENDYLAI